jgi:hypothetical protein
MSAGRWLEILKIENRGAGLKKDQAGRRQLFGLARRPA